MTVPVLAVGIFLAIAVSLGAAERDATSFRSFPSPGTDWAIVGERVSDDGRFSMRHLKQEKTGDVVACVAWHTPEVTIESDPVRQASIETITSTGYAYALTHKLGQPIADTIRHRPVSIDVRNHSEALAEVYGAIEYTYVYESADGDSPTTMAHGYVVEVGDFTVFLQHTANRVITSEIASGMALELGMDWSAEQISIPRGWSASISRTDK